MLADGDVSATIKVRASFTDDAGHEEQLTSAPTARMKARPLTAECQGMPAEHDGRRLFSFDLLFSDNFPGRFPHTTLKGAFTVTNGSVRSAERVVKGENRCWKIGVRPSSHDDVTITLVAGAVSTEGGRPLTNTVSATVDCPDMTADQHVCLGKSGASVSRTATNGSQEVAVAERLLYRGRGDRR